MNDQRLLKLAASIERDGDGEKATEELTETLITEMMSEYFGVTIDEARRLFTKPMMEGQDAKVTAKAIRDFVQEKYVEQHRS